MGKTWVTKYGVRRVRVEPPTFEDALYAAEGLTLDAQEQISIAAELMHLPLEEARAEAERVIRERAKRPQTVQASRSQARVVVERRGPRRTAQAPRRSSY